MSGISYLGVAPDDSHRFIVAEENSGQLATLNLHFDAAGALTLIGTVESIAINSTLDYEGIAAVDSQSVFLSEENNPGVRKFSLVDGGQLQSVAIPSVFDHRAANRGFESLTRSTDGAKLWTANEEALPADGLLATTADGTTVRLLELNVDADDVVAGSQFAYVVEPIHSTGLLGTPQSGLVDLVALPGGGLLSLERSFAALAAPTFLNRVFEIELAGATDVSSTEFDDGLDGQTYSSVGKRLLWEGAVDGGAGQNLEGLALGPQLANGDWVLVGVVDNGDPLSGNTLVTFTLHDESLAAFDADFNSDGRVDGGDLLSWQRGYSAAAATLADGDGDGDSDVDADDLIGWAAGFATAAGVSGAAAPEPPATTLMLISFASANVASSMRRRTRQRA
jgi:hypothetical protein